MVYTFALISQISTMPKPDDKPGGNQDGPKTAGSVIMPRREPVQTVEITINPPTIRYMEHFSVLNSHHSPYLTNNTNVNTRLSTMIEL